MPRLQFSSIYARVEAIAGLSSTKRDIVKSSIQMGLDEATSTKDMPYLMTPGVLRTVAPVTAGTVDATKDSITVSGTSTVFTSAMVGRKIRIDSENTYYRIAAVNSTTDLELDIEYASSSVTGSGYSIYKDEYRLPADANVYKIMRQLDDNISMGSMESTAFDIVEPSPEAEGSPAFEILRGTKLDTDSTGTVAGTVGGTTITGTTTTWTSLEGFGVGSRIAIGSQVYTVKSVDSDTQITIYETIASTFSGSTPTISLDNLIIQFFQIPDDTIIIRYYYQRIAYPLINDQDIPDLPDEFHHILITAGLIWGWATKDKAESKAQLVIFEKQKKDMWQRIGHISRGRNYPRRSQDAEMLSGGLRPPRYPSNVGPFDNIDHL